MANKIENKPPIIIKQSKRIKPDWLKTSILGGEKYSEMLKLVKDNNLYTICQSGKCPNIG